MKINLRNGNRYIFQSDQRYFIKVEAQFPSVRYIFQSDQRYFIKMKVV